MRISCAPLVLAFTPLLAAQTPTFRAGDLYLASDGLPAAFYGQGSGQMSGIVRIDPLSPIPTLVVTAPEWFGKSGKDIGFAYDPHRDRLILRANMGQGARLHAIDAAGGITILPTSGKTPRRVAPTGDGRIYLHDGTSTIRYLDAGNVEHVLLDSGGNAPYVACAFTQDLIYDPETATLLTGHGGGGVCECVSGAACVRSIPLSAAGDRVIGIPFSFELRGFDGGRAVRGLRARSWRGGACRH